VLEASGVLRLTGWELQMFVTTHSVAGITFRTESDVLLPGLAEPPFGWFRVGDGETPDVLHRLHQVPSDSLALSPPFGAERERIQQGAHLEQDALEGPLLRAPIVRAWLRESLGRPASVRISLYPNRAMVSNFGHHVVDLFHTDASEPETVESERPEPAGNDSEPRSRFRMHQLGRDPEKLPPLLAEERELLARQVCFSPTTAREHPFLRAPVVRDRLRSDLDQSKNVIVSVHTEGLVVYTWGDRMMDFYYYPGVDDPQEARIAGSYYSMFCAFLPDFSALPIHSSGVIRGDQAALFLAPDEGGKSTVLRHAAGAPWLNDDQVIVRREGDELLAHATPLGRRTSGPGQARLGGLFVLEKALHFELTPLKPAGLVKTLWNEHLFYTSSLPRHLKLQAFDLLYDMCHQVPIYRMRFPKDYVDWDAIDAALVCR
jgi:hypothetical protein